VTPKKLSRSTLNALKGRAGPQGPQGERGPQGPTGTVDTSNFYDRAASDARFLGIGATAANSSQLGGLGPSAFVHGDGRVLTNAQAALPDFDTFPVGTSDWQVWYTCPDVANPSATNGAIHFRNLTSGTLNLFVDNGGTNPAYQTLQPFPQAGDARTEPAAAAGEAIDFDVQGFPDGHIAHVGTVSVNRASDCHFQVWAIDTAG
jgi:hypothetical protein